MPSIGTQHVGKKRHQNEIVLFYLRGLGIALTIPDKPQSRLQKYKTTEQGNDWLKIQSGGK